MFFGLRRGRRKGFGHVSKDSFNENLTLNKIDEGRTAVIASGPRIPHMAALGLRPGKRVKVHARGRFRGPVIVEVDGRYMAVGRDIGSEIFVGD